MRDGHRRPHAQRAAIGLLRARDEFEQRRLARAVGSDHANDPARRQRKIRVIKEHFFTVGLREFLRLDHQRSKPRSRRDDDFKLTLFLGHVFLQHRLVSVDARLSLRLTRLRAGANPFQLAGHRFLTPVLGLLLHRRTRVFLLQPAGVISLPRNPVPVVEFQNPLGDIVQKIAVVRHRDNRARVTREMLLQPLNTLGIEMVRRLVEEQDVGLFQEQTRQRDTAFFTARKMIDHLVGRRTPQRVHRHLDLRSDVPRAEAINLFLKLRLFFRDRVALGIVGRRADFIPRRVVGRREIGEMLHAFLDALAHGFSGGELRFLFEQADRVAGLEMHLAVELRIAPRENAHERGFAGAVETEDTNLRAVVKRQRDVAEDFLALDFLRDAHHRKNDLRFVGLGHAAMQPAARRASRSARLPSASGHEKTLRDTGSAEGWESQRKDAARASPGYFAKENFAVWDLARAAAFLWTTPDLVALSMAET